VDTALLLVESLVANVEVLLASNVLLLVLRVMFDVLLPIATRRQRLDLC